MTLTAVPGVRVGHWTDAGAATGCTVVLLPAGSVASGESRGGAPGTREWALLDPARRVQTVDAVVLTGGSAFGLAACDGVVGWCEERGVGHPTVAGPVPIVVGMVLFDLAVGDPAVRPGPAQGRAACEAATTAPVSGGRVGAGAGATVGKWRGRQRATWGGLGSVVLADGDLVVAALVAVNAVGDVIGPGRAPAAPPPPPEADPAAAAWGVPGTTIGVVATNARLDKVGCRLVAASASDGLARVVDPVHLSVDGDAMVAAAVGGVEAPVDTVRLLAARAVAGAVHAAVPIGPPAAD